MKKAISILTFVIFATLGLSLIAQQARQIGQPQDRPKEKIDYQTEYHRLTAENEKLTNSSNPNPDRSRSQIPTHK